jgi:hypothetical protein
VAGSITSAEGRRFRSHLGKALIDRLLSERVADDDVSTTVDDLVHFVTADSPFYPRIGRWMREQARSWLDRADWLECEDEGEVAAESAAGGEDPAGAAAAADDPSPSAEATRPPDEPALLPDRWPRTDLDISVSLQLDERLGNCVYDGFWIDFGAGSLEHSVEMLRSHPDQPLIYGVHRATA